MFRAETASQELPVNYKTSLGNPSAFLKAGARITILSVLSRQVKNQTAILRNKENLRYIKDFPKTESKLQSDQNNNSKEPSMNSTKVLPLQCEENSRTVIDGTSEVVEGDKSVNEGSIGATNGVSESSGSGCSENGENNNGVFLGESASSKNESVVSKNCVNGNGKYEQEVKNTNMKTPFDYMKERKLSEPVMSPRKRTNVTIQKVARCRSTVDLRENEKPVLRELGGYKFFQKPNDVQESLTKKRTNSYQANENQTNDMMALKKTIARQKENIANREKHVLQMEKKICVLESENSKSKKQVASLREKLKDSSCTMDYLRFEKEQLASEKDRLNFTILTHEHELKELRTQNVNLVNEYENAEQSRMIAVGHLQEMERTCQNSHQESGTWTNFKKQLSAESTTDALKNLEKFTAQLNSVKECVQKLRNDREALQDEQKRMSSFLVENLKTLVDRVREMEMERKRGKDQLEEKTSEELVISAKENVTESEQLPENDKVLDLEVFKRKLKSNEQFIDQLANEIRDLENNKKGLLESRFAMIQEFQAGREFTDAEDWEEQLSEKDSDEKIEESVGSENKKQSSRVTRKIRKLERTLSMDHGVGKLDCIQKLCKKLEDCEEKVHDLETMNQELREEHDDMEEEAKYLKYVLSYRGDVMKAQLQTEFENKMAALKEELRVAKENSSGKSGIHELSERNRVLEDEVQRLHEELKSLLLNLPALQGVGELRSPLTIESDVSQSETVRSLEEKVLHLAEEKRVLLLSMQTLTVQRASRDVINSSSESDSLFSKSLMLEKTLREVENENACFVETFQRMRDVLEGDDEERSSDEQRDSSKILKLRDEIERLDEKAEASRKSILSVEDSFKDDVFVSCTRHEERILELEKEVGRLHEEKKSLLSTIIRLQTDPNFTFSDDVTDGDVSKSSLSSPVRAMIQEMAVGDVDGSAVVEGSVSVPNKADVVISSSPLAVRSFQDEEVQVGISEDLRGLLGHLERDLDRLKTALSQQCIVGYKMKEPNLKEDLQSIPQNDSPTDVEKRSMEAKELGQYTIDLQQKLDESESIRSDLHRTISIATDMATEERQKCTDLMRTKAALEKEMLKLAKENRDLRDGLETLSRVRKRRNSRGQSLSRASPTLDSRDGDVSVSYLPRAKCQNYSESEFSDLDSPVTETNSYSRI